MKCNTTVLKVIISVFAFNLFSCSSSSKNTTISVVSDIAPSQNEVITNSEITNTSIVSDTYTTNLEIASYSITFLNYNNEVLYVTSVNEGENVEYVGETPKKDGDEEIEYSFIGWDKELTNIKEDLICIAQFEAKPKGDWSEIYWGGESDGSKQDEQENV